MKKIILVTCINLLVGAAYAQFSLKSIPPVPPPGNYNPLILNHGFSNHEANYPPALDSFPSVDLLKKSKAQKKTARILLAGGAALIATAFIIPRGDLVEDGICIGIYCSNEYRNDKIKTALFLTGAGSALISIPFFIASRKNQRRATTTGLILKMDKTVFLQRNSFTTNSYPAVGIRLSR